jgi:hypothetical protein
VYVVMRTRATTSARRRGQRGISTAEVLAGAALALFVMGAVTSFSTAQSRALTAQNVYADSQTVTRSVIDLLTREIRMATYDPLGTALTPAPGPSCPGVKQGIIEASATRLHIRQDLTGDGLTTGAGEDVTYDVLGDALRRQEGTAAPQTLVTGIPSGGFQLRYCNGSKPPVEHVPGGRPALLTSAQRDCVTKVRISVTADLANPTVNAPLASIAQSEVAIRNRSLMNF